MWRVLQNILPTDDNLKHVGFSFPSFYRCYSSAEEDAQHIFLGYSYAQAVWSYFGGVFGESLILSQDFQSFFRDVSISTF